METTQKLNPLPYVTNMKMIAEIMWIFYQSYALTMFLDKTVI